MSSLTQTLIPRSQRLSAEALNDALDLSAGDTLSKRTGFLIMLTLSGVIAIAGVLTDSTATVIGAMIIAPLGTPILGIAWGIVTGHLRLVVSSILWVLSGVVIVIALGLVFAVFVAGRLDALTAKAVAMVVVVGATVWAVVRAWRVEALRPR